MDKIEQINLALFHLLPKDQKELVFGQAMCDIDGEFLGFMEVYESLSKLIPKHFTVIDLGCAYNPQCFYFTEHKKYIAVDSDPCVKFKSDNCEIYQKDIDKFIEEDLSQFNLSETFAICSYVPCDSKLLRETFKNLFVYYPHGGYDNFKL